jgi:hypothetical protein
MPKNLPLLIIPSAAAAFVVSSGIFDKSHAGTILLLVLIGIYFSVKGFSTLKKH